MKNPAGTARTQTSGVFAVATPDDAFPLLSLLMAAALGGLPPSLTVNPHPQTDASLQLHTAVKEHPSPTWRQAGTGKGLPAPSQAVTGMCTGCGQQGLQDLTLIFQVGPQVCQQHLPTWSRSAVRHCSHIDIAC